MPLPGKVEPGNFQRPVERERETKELIDNAQPHAGAPFQDPPDGQGQKEKDKKDQRDRSGPFRSFELSEHRALT